jgi:hypothetical protein
MGEGIYRQPLPLKLRLRGAFTLARWGNAGAQ